MVRLYLGVAMLSLIAACSPWGAKAVKDPSKSPTSATHGAGPLQSVVRLDESASGTAITLAPHQTLSVRLLGIPSAGYLWTVQSLPAQLARSGETSEPQDPKGRAKGMVGGSDWATFTFSPAASGTGELVLSYGRPWEQQAGKAPERTWKVQVNVLEK
jgi:predicted secreted protein